MDKAADTLALDSVSAEPPRLDFLIMASHRMVDTIGAAKREKDLRQAALMFEALGASNRLDDHDVERLLGELALDHVRDLPAGSLSGGERQLLSLARAMIAGKSLRQSRDSWGLPNIHKRGRGASGQGADETTLRHFPGCTFRTARRRHSSRCRSGR